MTLTIYHGPKSRSMRIIWLCEEAGIPYDLETFPVRGAYQASDAFRAIVPTAKVPAIKDDELILFESVAIMEYLLAKHGHGSLAPDPKDKLYGPYLQWLHFGESGMGQYVTTALAHRALLPEAARSEAMASWGEAETKKCLAVLDGPLSANEYLLPSGFSAADISVVYMLLLAKFAGMSKAFPDGVRAYFDRCAARDGWKVASQDW